MVVQVRVSNRSVYDRIRAALNLGEEVTGRALARLCELELVAYLPFGRYDSEGFRQVLSLPSSGPASSDETDALWTKGRLS
jgi:hypothetical protein